MRGTSLRRLGPFAVAMRLRLDFAIRLWKRAPQNRSTSRLTGLSLNIVENLTRECLRAVLDTSSSGRRVVRELDDLIAERGAPRMIVSDNGTELTSNAVLAWSGDARVE